MSKSNESQKPLDFDLRDRIARVLYRCDYDLRDWEKATDVGKQPYYDDADAVIEALGLKLESGRNVVWSAHGLTDKATRYVTEWTTNE